MSEQSRYDAAFARADNLMQRARLGMTTDRELAVDLYAAHSAVRETGPNPTETRVQPTVRAVRETSARLVTGPEGTREALPHENAAMAERNMDHMLVADIHGDPDLQETLRVGAEAWARATESAVPMQLADTRAALQEEYAAMGLGASSSNGSNGHR